MKRTMKRTTKIVAAVAVAGAVTAGAGVTYAVAQDDNGSPVTDSDRQRAADAALAETGGGTVTEVERDDDGYEVEVRTSDGRLVDIDLDRGFAVIGTDAEDDDDDADDDRDDADDREEAAVDETARRRASDAALAETGGGTVTSVEHDGDGYEVEVTSADGTEWDVDLDGSFAVRRAARDD
jgi:uncharacterized membrane protein YkoI